MLATVMRAGMDGTAIYDWTAIRSALRTIATGPAFDIFVYRHAETTFNERGLVSGGTETDLTERGREAARGLAGHLPKGAGLVVCSGLRRSQETAHLALQGYPEPHPEIEHDARLNEVSLGSLEGRPKLFLPQFASGDIDWAPTGGETYRRAARRVLSSLVDIAGATAGISRCTLVFAHAGVMRILCTLSDEEWTSARMYALNFDDRMCVKLSSASLRLQSFWHQENRHA